MKITIIVEGKTEKAFIPVLRDFLKTRLEGKMPKVVSLVQDGRIPKEGKLSRLVSHLLLDGSDAVIALTDVYTGTGDFHDAQDAKDKMRKWVGAETRFFPHAAQYDFEAWLMPYWPEIQKLAGHKKARPAGRPEQLNHQRPPSKHIEELFRIGTCGRDYIKERDAVRILRDQDLGVAVEECPELKSFINTIFLDFVAASCSPNSSRLPAWCSF